jgi:2-polyprenyl-3-methyl-5-hydroxy-6-metoxy-1,4-benzoquinol methylase
MVHYRVHHDPKSSHQQISKLVRDLRLDPVLDVGCAQGMLGHLVRDAGLTIDGVEYNPAWADLARPHYRNVWSGAIEDAPLPDREYRLVVCGDVLEHTVNPVSVLKRLMRAATEDATFIVSLPNIAHFGVRLMLLFGYFPKMERGPLDKTHLHFFTKDTARQMVESAGLVVKRTSCTGVPLDEVWKDGQGGVAYKVMTKLQHAALAVAPRLFGFQWIMVCQPAAAAARIAEAAPTPTRELAGATASP